MTTENHQTNYPGTTIYQPIPSFGADSGIPPRLAAEYRLDFCGFMVSLLFIIMIFSLIKNYRVAWFVATLLTPFVVIIFISLFGNFLNLYLLYVLNYLLVVSGILSALIGFLIYLLRRYRARLNN